MKNRTVIILILLFILMAVIGYYFYAKEERKVKALTQQRIIALKELRSTRDELGREKAKVQVLVIDHAGAKALLRAKDQQLQRITTEYKLKLKNLKAVASLSQVTEAQVNLNVEDSVRGGDTLKVLKHKDPFFSFNQIIQGNKSVIQPVFTNDFDVIFHRERIEKRHVLDFFRPYQVTAQINNKSPYVTTKSFEAKYIEPGKKWYERNGVVFALGVLSGIVIVNQLK